MNEITTLFTTIGDFFTKSDWFAMVKWPFWMLLFTVAVSGVYCARFGKKTLLNQAISATLGLVTIYLFAVAMLVSFPFVKGLVSNLPFLTVTETSVSVVDIFSLTPITLPPMLLRLMLLTLMVCCADLFFAGGKTIISWLLSHILSTFAALVFYAIVTAGITMILPSLLGRFAFIPVILVAVLGLLVLCAKIIFTVVISGGNPIFSSIYKFLTVNRGGSLFTISFLCFLFTLTLLVVLRLSGSISVPFDQVNRTALWIVFGLVMATLHLFSRFFIDRKKS